jgi:hypothetical protein
LTRDRSEEATLVEIRGGRGKVLILTPQPMTGALIGMLVELAQLEPVFADTDERPEDALARVHPLLVIVADGAIDSYRSDLFVARTQHRGVGIVVFGLGSDESVAEWARQRDLPYLTLPTDAERFGRIIDQAIRKDRRSRLAGDRRTPARIERAADGTLVFHDEEGRRWYVYDRRTGERRRSNPTEAESYRLFVSDDGLELRCSLAPHEFSDKTPATLERQLARATAD